MTHALIHRARALHLALASESFYPLALSSALSVGILAARIGATRGFMFNFMAWNLFLAWVPYTISLACLAIHRLRPAQPRRTTWLLGAGFSAWLLFFPNATYVITDLIHLHPRSPVPLWYDMGLLATMGWTGCCLAAASLSSMHRIVAERVSARGGWLFAVMSLGLGALGMYLGRFLRWNSWDMLLRPWERVSQLFGVVRHPIENASAWGFTAMFTAFSLACYLSFRGVSRPALLPGNVPAP